MTESHDRRSFFKQLLRGAAQTAAEVGEAFKELQEPEKAEADPWQITWSGTGSERPVPAHPTTAAATPDDLRALAAEAGLAERVDDVLAHARTGFRMTHDEGAPGSRLGGAPDLPAGFEWPRSALGDLAFVAQVRLEEVAAAGPSAPLPQTGSLLVFYDLERRPTGLQPADRDACRVVHVDVTAAELEPADRRASLARLPVSASVEVTLPSESGGLPSSLSLDPDELDAWQRLRERLAELQGVEVEDRAVEWHALHRLLGHPDTTDDAMALDAQLVFNGIDLNAGERWFDPRVPDLEKGADEWRLLLQLSADDELGLELGYPIGRLYLWIRDGDLRQGRFDDVWAFVR